MQVVRDPSSVSALDFALPVFELVPIHRAPKTVNDRVNSVPILRGRAASLQS
jgi:hypothetical protein